MERFTEKIGEPFDVHNDCWEWTGAKQGTGYGVIWDHGKQRYAHCLSHELFIGPIPKGHAVDHMCRNVGCVRPDHLQTLTHHENAGQFHRSKTHCINGHPYSGDNLYVKPSGERCCRTCRREQYRKYRQRTGGLI